MPRNKEIWILALLMLAVLGSGCVEPPKSGVARGEFLYQKCVACHMDDGGGSQMIGAPAIAGLTAWYVEGQLKKFQNGARGAHPDDEAGLRMRPMSRLLKAYDEGGKVNAADTQNNINSVAEYIEKMPRSDRPPTITGGDPAKGKTYFAVCTACHGADGAGNKALNAPSLRNSNDWYLANQLRKFKAGIRGTNPKDVTGAQMRPMAMTLLDEQAEKDVIAYIMTLSN